MSEFGHGHGHGNGNGNAFGRNKKADEAGFDLAGEGSFSSSSLSGSKGSDLQAADLDRALAGAFEDPASSPGKGDQNSSAVDSGDPEANHFSPDQLANARGLDPNKVERASNPAQLVGENGDLLDGKGGTNTIIAGATDDVVFSNTEGADNTITTGLGRDTIVLGEEATADILDFDPAQDRFGLEISVDRIVYGQGQNPEKGGLEQPLDSENNTLILDRDTGHTLASLRFVNSTDLSEKNFVTFDESAAPNRPEQA